VAWKVDEGHVASLAADIITDRAAGAAKRARFGVQVRRAMCEPLARAPHLVRRPSSHLAAGELTHAARVPVDVSLALEQGHGYVGAFRERGWDVTTVDPADEHPDGVFVEDAVVVFDGLAVLTSPGAETRRGELATVAPTLDGLGLTIRRIERPGTLDGGDVLKVGRTAYVGRSARTNEAAIDQLRSANSRSSRAA
jgi:dimethylargininase